MSIYIDTAMDPHKPARKMYAVRVKGKAGVIMVGRPTQGKHVAIRSFTIALRLLTRGT